ncbi:O-antigen ligase family protein [Caproicibacter fermentans]|uniref:O-antigen ligase family protein n=1 Tax=Caproicibacter fermentans TaxID=2576756 RepID=A0A7G8T679_9FIRM|nr:O-antigen ligase family protein [Caproicibacter fermentans]QNK39120.1 O-antigen ligase family protein [Caproicibacter fermentans]
MSSKKKAIAAKKNSKKAEATSVLLSSDRNRLFLPVLLALAVIPLTVHMTIVSVDPNEAKIIGTDTYGDLFSQCKAWLLFLTGIILLAVSAFNYKKILKKQSRIYTAYLVAGGVFLLFTLLSACFSQYSSIAFWGAHDRAEGALILCCYILLLFYTMYAYRTERDCRNLFIALGIVVTVSSFLGSFQYFGHDLFQTDFSKLLTVFPWDFDRIKKISLQSSSGRLYGTFYHWDYAGSFAAIAAPVFFVPALFAKNLRARLALWSMALLSVWLLLGSTSRAGIVGVVFALIFGIVFFWKILTEHWKISLSAFAFVMIALIGVNTVSHGKIFSRIPSLLSDVSAVFQNSSGNDYLSQLPVKDISVKNGGTIEIVTQNNDVLNAALKQNSLDLKDGSGRSVSIQMQNGLSAITDPRFQRIGFGLTMMGLDQEFPGIAVSIDGQPQFFFRIDSGDKLQMTNSAGTVDIDSLKTPPTFGFKGKEKLGSARGYIWSRALPMASERLLLGAGPDTFELYFPQNDLLGKYWAYGTANMLVDKPHNLYLQTLLGEGGVALAAFLAMMLLYLIDSFRLYAMKREYQKNQIRGIALCLGIVGYLFAGLFNDSVVSVAPAFWILLGAGIAINFQNRRELSNGPADDGGKETD